MPKTTFTVVIPLYNKEREIEATLRSVLAQNRQPEEIVVVDDGSTDRSAEVVRRIGSPLVRLIQQPNAGVSAARNRGIAEARSSHIALLDGDDGWEPGYLAAMERLIDDYPDCGLYCAGFTIESHDGCFPASGLDRRGVVENFFRDSAHRYIAIPSASCIPRRVFDTIGGFPAGMKIAEDLYLWIEIARRYRVCYTPERLVRYSRIAQNRSASGYTPERTDFSFEKLYNPDAPEEEREFIARAALGKALVLSVKGGTEEAARAARFFHWTKTYRRTLRKVRLLNRLPVAWRGPLLDAYNALAWRLARKGL
ncbi:glycosyltransferase [Alistipes sp. An54]|uniref:glycosyltransferase family 2 protein n=1 Tax=Alistipes sp. An54 TaxID=1965645 RepID=UPI000B3A1892|nr:glycosyltransferase family A protein [Alistipes sp. An54]OUN78106.1 glycosyltransferase [Alistipes sp. An54]